MILQWKILILLFSRITSLLYLKIECLKYNSRILFNLFLNICSCRDFQFYKVFSFFKAQKRVYQSIMKTHTFFFQLYDVTGIKSMISVDNSCKRNFTVYWKRLRIIEINIMFIKFPLDFDILPLPTFFKAIREELTIDINFHLLRVVVSTFSSTQIFL